MGRITINELLVAEMQVEEETFKYILFTFAPEDFNRIIPSPVLVKKDRDGGYKRTTCPCSTATDRAEN